MKRVTIYSATGFDSEEHATNVLRQAGIDVNEGHLYRGINSYRWWGTFDIGDNRWKVLRKLTRSYDPNPPVCEKYVYSDDDIAQAELLLLEVTTTSRGDTGIDLGNTYDLTHACMYCYSGARALSPFRIAKRDLPIKRNISHTFDHDILVQSELMEQLEALSGSDKWLLTVEDRRTKAKLPWKVISPEAVLPKVHSLTTGFHRDIVSRSYLYGIPMYCPKCERDNYSPEIMGNPFQLFYDRSEVMKAVTPYLNNDEQWPCVAASWERLGPGTGPEQLKIYPELRPRVPTPMIIVNQRVAQIFKQCVPKYIKLQPVFLVE